MHDKPSEICRLDCDFHTHTGFSDDCDIPPETMLESAYAKGIKTLAVTVFGGCCLTGRGSFPHRI